MEVCLFNQTVRAGMLENLRADYVRTARSKGLNDWTVIIKHAFRNSVIPVITIMATLIPALLGGSVIIEQIFSIRAWVCLPLRRSQRVTTMLLWQ
jgi:peptide/nickel transport system permease protein